MPGDLAVPLTNKLSGDDEAELRRKVQKKLEEYLSTATDTVLCEYVMVMVGNRKTSKQIAGDLDAFLGEEEAKEFTMWLWDRMKEIQNQAIGGKGGKGGLDGEGQREREPVVLTSSTQRTRDRSRERDGDRRRGGAGWGGGGSRGGDWGARGYDRERDERGGRWDRDQDRDRGYRGGRDWGGGQRRTDSDGRWGGGGHERDRDRDRDRDRRSMERSGGMASEMEWERDRERAEKREPRQTISSRLLLMAVNKASKELESKSARAKRSPPKQDTRDDDDEEAELQHDDSSPDEPAPEPAVHAQKQAAGQNQRSVTKKVLTPGDLRHTLIGNKNKATLDAQPVSFSVVLPEAEGDGDAGVDEEWEEDMEEQYTEGSAPYAPHFRGGLRGRGVVRGGVRERGRGRGRGGVIRGAALRGRGGIVKSPRGALRGVVRGAARGRGGGAALAAMFVAKKWVKPGSDGAAADVPSAEGVKAAGADSSAAANRKEALKKAPVVGQVKVDGALGDVVKKGMYKAVKWVKPGLKTPANPPAS